MVFLLPGLLDNCERMVLFGGLWAAWYLSMTSRHVKEALWPIFLTLKHDMARRLIVIGGHGGRGEGQRPYSSAEVWDERCQSWSALAGPSLARMHGVAVAVNHYLYVLGGRTSDCHTTTSVERLDFYRGLPWECAPSMTNARYSTAALCLSGMLCILGGFDGVDALDSCEALRHADYYLNSDSWQALAPLPFPRGKHAAVAIASSLYLVGGMDSGYRSLNLASKASCLHANLSDWAPLPPMQNARSGCAAAAVRGAIVVVGGVANGWTTLSSVERFHPEIERWEMMAPMSIIRRESAAVCIADELWVLGGASYGGRSSGQVEILGEASFWKPGTSHTPRSGCAAALLRG